MEQVKREAQGRGSRAKAGSSGGAADEVAVKSGSANERGGTSRFDAGFLSTRCAAHSADAALQSPPPPRPAEKAVHRSAGLARKHLVEEHVGLLRGHLAPRNFARLVVVDAIPLRGEKGSKSEAGETSMNFSRHP
eukprot:2574993-Pleurochrysis_carterae.AAC.2